MTEQYPAPTQQSRIRSRAFPALSLFFFAGMALWLSGCVTMSDPEASQEFRAETAATVRPGQPAGQTFIARRPGLNGITLWLQPQPPAGQPAGELTAELFHSPEDTEPLVTQVLPLSKNGGQMSISFPARSDPPNQPYYLRLASSGAAVRLLGRSEDAYAGGQAYANGQPLDADLSFRLAYDYGLPAMFSDLATALRSAWLALPLLLMLWLPGRVLLGFAGREFNAGWGERTALSLGLSMAALPVALTWTSITRLRWSPGVAWLAAGALGAVYAWQRLRRDQPAAVPAQPPQTASLRPQGATLLLAAIFILSLGVRLAMARDLAVSPWVDSVHHAWIARLVTEGGGFPDNYAPVIEIDHASYHAGFHSLVAGLSWLSGLVTPDAMLLLGQVLNSLAVFAAYLLAVLLFQDPLAGVAAALVTGLVTPMPAYYTSWGRYTELAGLLILPAAVSLVVRLWDAPATSEGRSFGRQHVPLVLLAGIACGGLFLTHYRVLAFLATLLVALALPRWFTRWRNKTLRQTLPSDLLRTLLAAIAAIALTLPWWPATLSSLIVPTLSWGKDGARLFGDFSWSYLTSALGRYSLFFAGLGLVLGLLMAHPAAFAISVWVALMFGLANLGVLRLPGGNLINNTSVEISLFLPISALVGYLLSQGLRLGKKILPERLHLLLDAILLALGMITALAGARQLLPLLNPVTMLFREEDRPAMAWIGANIPADETVLVNAFLWGYGTYAGSDGGYWIGPLAGRRTMPPPVLYGIDQDLERLRAIKSFNKEVLDQKDDPQALASLMRSRNLRYLYIGAKGGAFSPRLLQESGLFQAVYHNGNTWVFYLE